MLLPGVIDSKINLVEHPEVVAQRIEQAVAAVGDRERVIAGADCGFGTFAGWEWVAEDVVWLKLKTLREGADIATKRLWGKKAARSASRAGRVHPLANDRKGGSLKIMARLPLPPSPASRSRAGDEITSTAGCKPGQNKQLRGVSSRAWQRMLSGRRLDLLDPSALDIEIEDIAHGLARVARWNGQTAERIFFRSPSTRCWSKRWRARACRGSIAADALPCCCTMRPNT